MDWWKTRLRPEIDRNFAYLDGFDTDGASLLDLAVLLEDAIEDLWKAKEEVKRDPELADAFERLTAGDVMSALRGTERGRRFIAERIETHQTTFGYKAMWSH